MLFEFRYMRLALIIQTIQNTMQRIHHLFSFLLLTLTIVTLAGCESSGGLSTSPWVFSSSDSSAELPPEDLASGLEADESSDMLNPASADGSNLSDDMNPAMGDMMAVADNGPVKVALLLPLSGEHSSLGQAMLNAAQLALFDIGYEQLELLPRDTQGTPEGARMAAQKVVDEGAKLILGPLFSSSVAAVKPVASRANVNIVAFSTDWSLADRETFIMGFLPFDQIERLVQYIAYRNIGQVGILAPASDYGRIVTSAYQKMADRYGMVRAQASFFPQDSTNLAPIIRDFSQYDARNAEEEITALERFKGIEDKRLVAELKALSEPIEVPQAYEAVLMPVGGEAALSISNLLSHFDMPPSKVQRLGTGLFDDTGLAAEQSLDGAWFAAPSPRLRQPFESRFRELYGTKPPRLATLAYDATALAVVLARNGIKTNGRPNFSRTAIMNPNGFSGIDGIFRFRPNGTVERGLAILQFDDGEIEVLEDAPRTFQTSTAAQ